MPVVFVHLSDIHFGQEKGGRITTNNDVKQQLLQDAHDVVGNLLNRKADGIIISGDIAYSGKEREYRAAGQWLDQLTAAVGCSRTAVLLVPGNHDVDLSAITPVTETIINDIFQKGDAALDKYLENENDRQTLYQRFIEYRVFAAGYNCALNGEGTILGDHYIEIASGKHLKFHGINTALICSKNKNEEGSLLLGERQRVIPRSQGVEVIVIGHHPMNWLQDSSHAMRYIKSRARMFISGHEHNPSHVLENIDQHSDLLCVAAGATVPPTVSDQYTYCYNILEFEWDDENNRLVVTIHPRKWDQERTIFVADRAYCGQDKCTFTLKCPNFKKEAIADDYQLTATVVDTSEPEPPLEEELTQPEINMPAESDQLLLLRFFRELSSAQRLEVLIQLGAIPPVISNKITHTIETTALKVLFKQGKHDELQNAINGITSQKIEEQND